MDFETRAIHEGQEPDPATGAIITPIYQTSTYVQESLGHHKGYEYARGKNPTREALERNEVRSMERQSAADGNHAWFHIIASPLDGNLAVWFADITARKQAELIARQTGQPLNIKWRACLRIFPNPWTESVWKSTLLSRHTAPISASR